MGTNHISGTAKARVIKFYTPVGYIKSQHMEAESTLIRVWSGSHDPFSFYGSPMISLERLKLES